MYHLFFGFILKFKKYVLKFKKYVMFIKPLGKNGKRFAES